MFGARPTIGPSGRRRPLPDLGTLLGPSARRRMRETSGPATAACPGEGTAMYAVVRNSPDEASDVVQQARQREESIKEVMRGIDGFGAYFLIDTQSGGLASVSVFQDREGADEPT